MRVLFFPFLITFKWAIQDYDSILPCAKWSQWSGVYTLLAGLVLILTEKERKSTHIAGSACESVCVRERVCALHY